MDRARTEALGLAIMIPVRDNFQRGPASRDRAYEALNALAVGAAYVIAGAGDNADEALAWFQLALSQQLLDLVELVENPRQ